MATARRTRPGTSNDPLRVRDPALEGRPAPADEGRVAPPDAAGGEGSFTRPEETLAVNGVPPGAPPPSRDQPSAPSPRTSAAMVTLALVALAIVVLVTVFWVPA